MTDAFHALAKEFQTLIDEAFDFVANKEEPPLKKQKLLGAVGGDSEFALDKVQISTTTKGPSEKLHQTHRKKQDSISVSSVPRAFIAFREIPILPADNEFFTRFEQAFDLESSGDDRITRDTWRRVCAFFIEEQWSRVRRQQELEQQELIDSAEEEVQPELDDELKNLVQELLQTRHNIPLPFFSALDNLSITSLVVVVKIYIYEYPYEKIFTRYWPKKLTPPGNPSLPTDSERKRFRLTLKAFVDFPRSALRVLDSSIDPSKAQRDFIMEEIIMKRDELEAVGSKHWTLLKQLCVNTATSSVSQTPISSGHRDKSLSDLVYMRDNYCCLMSGIMSHTPATLSDEPKHQGLMRPDPNRCIVRRISGRLKVTHGMPLGLAQAAWTMLEAITGMSFEGWKAECPENALILHHGLHDLFGEFQLYLELNDDKQFIIRARKFPSTANPVDSLAGINSAYMYSSCDKEGVLLDMPLHLPPPLGSDEHVPFLDYKFFLLHRLIGDVFWMVAAADPSVLAPDDDDEEERVVNELNIYWVLDKLDSESVKYEDVLLPRFHREVY